MNESPAERDEFIARAKLNLQSVSIEDLIKDRLGDQYNITTAKVEMPKLIAEIRAVYSQHKDW